MTVTLLGAADTLDRQSGRRGDRAYLSGLFRHREARVILIENLDPLVRAASPEHAALIWFPASEILERCEANSLLFLGISKGDGVPHFALRLALDQREAFSRIYPLEAATDFRTLASAGTLTAADLALVGLSRSLYAWHDSARHCGFCGRPTGTIDGGWKRHCEPCAKDTFPRIDPVVIMLVTDGERCVLAHEPRYAPGMFSTIAGYLEPGEDIAHAVARETYEELGVTVTNVAFYNSQPWPFPHSLMIGCVAYCAPTLLTIDRTELVEARWFSRADAAHMLARTHPEGLWVPGPQAIAYHLIQHFVAWT
jgi:NAD+ diphosphatase